MAKPIIFQYANEPRDSGIPTDQGYQGTRESRVCVHCFHEAYGPGYQGTLVSRVTEVITKGARVSESLGPGV